jgi:hypothetical protein
VLCCCLFFIFFALQVLKLDASLELLIKKHNLQQFWPLGGFCNASHNYSVMRWQSTRNCTCRVWRILQQFRTKFFVKVSCIVTRREPSNFQPQSGAAFAACCICCLLMRAAFAACCICCLLMRAAFAAC